jgi:hypothetical protein
VLDLQGEISHFIAVKQDITERKRPRTESQPGAHRCRRWVRPSGWRWPTATRSPMTLQRCAEALVTHLEPPLPESGLSTNAKDVLELQAEAGLYTHVNGRMERIPLGQFTIGTDSRGIASRT